MISAAASLTRAGSGGDAVESVFTTIAAWLDYQICDGNGLTPDGRDFICERPGIVRAAIADIPPYHPEFGPDHVATALHHIVEDPTTAYWAAQTGLRFDGWWPLSGFHVLVIDRDQVSRLGHEWCNRLIPVTGRRSNELGFALLWSMMSGKDATFTNGGPIRSTPTCGPSATTAARCTPRSAHEYRRGVSWPK